MIAQGDISFTVALSRIETFDVSTFLECNDPIVTNEIDLDICYYIFYAASCFGLSALSVCNCRCTRARFNSILPSASGSQRQLSNKWLYKYLFPDQEKIF